MRSDARRIKGIHANAAMRTDPHDPSTTLIDPVGSSTIFHDTMVRLVPA